MTDLEARATFKSDIESIVSSSEFSLRIKGSIPADDFHLHGKTSFSDVDLVLPGVTEDKRYDIADGVKQAIFEKTGYSLPVTVQPDDHFLNLSLEDSRLMALSEYMRRIHKGVSTSEYGDFIRAKSTLMVANEHPGQRYRQIAASIGNSAAQKALAVKLGDAVEFSAEDSLKILEAVTKTEETEWLKRYMQTQDADAVIEWCLQQLPLRETIPSWLKDMMPRLLN